MLKQCWNMVFLGLWLLLTVPIPTKALPSGFSNLDIGNVKQKLDFPTDPSVNLIRKKGEDSMVLIRGGMFKMGSKFSQTIDYYNLCKKLDKRCKVWWFRDERPEHSVFVKSFWIDKFEITNTKYLQFVKATGHRPALDDSCKTNACKEGNLWDGIFFPNKIKNQPVIQVNWFDADSYCRWRGGRLPTEAEWEKAARGPTNSTYPWGNSPPTPNHATYNRKWRGLFTMTDVGSLPLGASKYGIFDLAGNVWEWMADWYGLEYYKASSRKNPRGPGKGKFKTVRGGSWVNNSDVLHSTYRRWSRPEVRFNDTGFRCVKDAADETETK